MNVYQTRRQKHLFEKQCIGAYTAWYLREYASYHPVAVDGGSTNYWVLNGICQDAREQRPTVSQVLTNHLEGLYLARDLPDGVPPEWRCTGGLLRTSRAVLVEGADAAIHDCGFWIAVVGANGFEPPWLQTTTERERPVKKAMAYGARHSVIFPLDSSKWGYPAGTFLFTLDELIACGKRIVLITGYPVRDETESEDGYKNRLSVFLDRVTALVEQWRYDLAVYTAAVDLTEVNYVDVRLPDATALAAKLRGGYTQMISPGRENQVGFMIRFDLWSDPC